MTTDVRRGTPLSVRLAWGSALVLALASMSALSVLLYRNYHLDVPASSIPRPGFRINDTIRARLRQGGRLLVVSETCRACIERADAFVNRVDTHPSELLVVIGDRPDGVFKRAVQLRPHMPARSVFLESDQVDRYLAVKASPVFVVVDNDGRVLRSGYETAGTFVSAANVRSWMQAWRDLIATKKTS